jgi:hypothetical protein
LGIQLHDKEKFTNKRLFLLEAMLSVAVVNALKDDLANTLVAAVHAKIDSEWSKRGLITPDSTGNYDLCFPEIIKLLENPLGWSKEWLDEFYKNTEWANLEGGPHIAAWAEQCSREYKAMNKMLVRLNI